MLKNAILSFNKQFEYHPEIVNQEKLTSYSSYVVVGMGGSHLAADLIKMWNPYRSIYIHENYDLPKLPDALLKQSLIIADSYSGNTEEVIDVFTDAEEKDLSLAAISIGGQLIEHAKKEKIPFIQLPDTHIQPRSALGYSTIALLALMNDQETLPEILALSTALEPEACEPVGKKIAESLQGRIPLIYSSTKNKAIAYNWKIKFNENSKIPAFYNIFPELNHNEMTGFDVVEATKPLSQPFTVIMLRDSDDDGHIQKRMDITKKLYQARGVSVIESEITGNNQYHKTFTSLLTADWVSLHLAEQYGVESEQVPMVEEFKKMI